MFLGSGDRLICQSVVKVARLYFIDRLLCFFFELLILVSQFLEEESTAERHLSSICRTYTSGPGILRPTLQSLAPNAVHWPPLVFIITIGEKYLV